MKRRKESRYLISIPLLQKWDFKKNSKDLLNKYEAGKNWEEEIVQFEQRTPASMETVFTAIGGADGGKLVS